MQARTRRNQRYPTRYVLALPSEVRQSEGLPQPLSSISAGGHFWGATCTQGESRRARPLSARINNQCVGTSSPFGWPSASTLRSRWAQEKPGLFGEGKLPWANAL